MRYSYRPLLSGLLAILAGMLGSAALADSPPVAETYGDGENAFLLATGSPGELGLLGALADGFSRQTPVTLHWIKAGSGKSLALLKDRQVDMIMVHAPAAEKQAVAEGWATDRTLLGSNEFYIVGPADDPAGVKNATSAADAFRRIAEAQAKFITRADNSGTHKKELKIWQQAGVEPGDDWYIATHDFMTASLAKANAIGGYFMTDSSTWVAEQANMPNLAVLYRGDKVLVNTYHALLAPEEATPGRTTARQFIAFVASEEGQQIIHNYGKDRYGESLYQDAAYARQYVD